MSAASGNGRSDDTGSCKSNASTIVMEDMTQALNPVIQPTGSKADRGFNHKVLWLMVAPMSLVDEYKSEGKIDQ